VAYQWLLIGSSTFFDRAKKVAKKLATARGAAPDDGSNVRALVSRMCPLLRITLSKRAAAIRGGLKFRNLLAFFNRL